MFVTTKKQLDHNQQITFGHNQEITFDHNKEITFGHNKENHYYMFYYSSVQ